MSLDGPVSNCPEHGEFNLHTGCLRCPPTVEAWRRPVTAYRSQDNKIRYVAGFLFDEERESVALIEKQKPAWMAGKLNAVGGKIEGEETPAEAMTREFGEEAGVGGLEWQPVAVLYGPDWECHFFAAFSVNILFVRSQEAEQIAVYDVPSVLAGKYPLMTNLPTLLALALDQSGIVKPVAMVDGQSQERKAA